MLLWNFLEPYKTHPDRRSSDIAVIGSQAGVLVFGFHAEYTTNDYNM